MPDTLLEGRGGVFDKRTTSENLGRVGVLGRLVEFQ